MRNWLKTVAVAALGVAALSGQALAWGDSGHRMVGEEAMRALPDDLPAFLKTPEAIADIGEYSREPDRWRGAGKVHDNDRDPAHFLDLTDDGKTLSGLGLFELPATRSDFDAATRANGSDPFKSGYLYYSTVDANQQIIKDMAFWRVLTYLVAHETDAKKLAWYKADLIRREDLLKRDIGVLSHYVGDSTQPLHLSIHYNGWGSFPNPNGYTLEHMHVPIEGAFVSATVKAGDVRAQVAPYTPCPDKLEVCEAKRLTRNFTQIIPFYDLEKAGGFKDADPRGKAFLTTLIARGAADLRDVVTDAWHSSKTMSIGFQNQTYEDIAAGKVADPFALLHGE